MTLHKFKAQTIDDTTFDFNALEGKKVLIINTASACGLTPQYAELEELYQKYNNQNFEIIAFPCNDFGAQEPGTPAEIKEFCSTNYNVSFPIMEKISVHGTGTHPVYQWLLNESSAMNKLDHIKWNFQKFLINEKGNLVDTLEPTISPMDGKITDWIDGK